MFSVFRHISQYRPGALVLFLLAVTAAGILLLITLILLRRALRNRYFRIRDRRIQYIRNHWPMILSGEIPVDRWFSSRANRAIVESVLLEKIEIAQGETLSLLQDFARSSGLAGRRISEVRRKKGWNQRLALIALGRMRLPESVPVLAQALGEKSGQVVIDAIRALGQVGIPEAARRILEHLSLKPRLCTPQTAQSVLVRCYRSNPQLLFEEVVKANDTLRPILARALAEVADGGVSGELMHLVQDPLAEVRASAARILAAVRPPYALDALSILISDPEWFVRLRAAVAIGELGQKPGIPLLIKALCDRNRLVRLRAASALVSFRGQEERVIRLAAATRDRYALQALVSEMQRSGRLTELVDSLASDDDFGAVESVLLTALRNGCMRMLTDLLLHHPSRRVRARLARILACSGYEPFRQYLIQVQAVETDLHQQMLLRWVSSRMDRTTDARRFKEEVVSA